MSTDLDPLSSDILRALDVERGRPPLPEAQLSRLAARLDATFALLPPVVPSTPTEPTGGGTPAASTGAASGAAATAAKVGVATKGVVAAGLGAKAAVLVAAGAAAVGGVTGAQLQSRLGTPREVIIERRVEVPVPAPVPREAPEPPPPLDVSPPPVEPKATAGKKLRTPFEMERLYIEQATVALTRGNAQQALDACAQHLASFRNGQLSEERESLAIRALLLLGRRNEARSRAAAFRARFPDGLLIDVVDAALDEDARVHPDP